MGTSDSVKQHGTSDRDSTKSTNQLIIDNYNNHKYRTDETTKKSKNKSESSLPQVPADRPSFRGPFGITIPSTIIWYLCICILFLIAFLSLILSVLYFVTDTTTEQVVKLYGICGAGTLAFLTFAIIFLDCCNDRSRKDHEEEARYRILQEKEAREKAMTLRRNRRLAEGKEKPIIAPHQRPQKISPEPLSPSPSQPQCPHCIYTYPFTAYHHPFVCPICHDLHASGNARHNLTDIAVDTSDKFAPISKTTKTIPKSTRDAQTEPTIWEAERGTQTDRTEGTQTSTIELNGLPNNVTQIIHETTILKAPRYLLNTLKKSMTQQDKDVPIHQTMTDTNTTTAVLI